MKKTISVKEIVKTFDDYLKDTSKGVVKEDINTFFYTNNCSRKEIRKIRTYKYRKMKVSESELLDLKEKELKKLYDRINSEYRKHSYNLFINELVFRRMYECYQNYKDGKIEEDREIDFVEDIFGCDKNSDEYFFSTMNKLFENCVWEMYSYNYEYFFYLFPDTIKENYFSWDEDIEDYNAKAEEAQDFNEMMIEATKCLESWYYNLNAFHYVVKDHMYNRNWTYSLSIITDKYLNPDSPDYVYEGLNGLDVYDFGIGLDEENDNRWQEEAEKLLYDFWIIRHDCMRMLCLITKIEKGETKGIDENIIEWYKNAKLIGVGFREQYDKLSFDDFRMEDDGTLKIINNQGVYRLFGVDEKYIEVEAELEEEFGR